MKTTCKLEDTRRGILQTGQLDDSAASYTKAFMAIPKNKNDTSKNLKNSEIYRTSRASDARRETDTSDESLFGSKDTSELSSIEGSDCDLRLSSSICQEKQRMRMQRNSLLFSR
jgi:hypothetical protein